MHLSIVVPCFNNADTLACQLDALSSQNTFYTWEVIVSDNGSSDDSIAIARTYQEKLANFRIVDSSDRRGPSHARNVGAQAATGDSIAFCDADDEIASGWITTIIEALSQHDFVASQFDFEKLNQTQISKYRPTERHRQEYKLQTKPFATLPYAGTSGIAIKKHIHELVGGFDESILFCEDTDYCWRVQMMGVSLHLIPEAIIYIRRHNSSLDLYKQATSWAEYNVLLYKKYQSTSIVEVPSSKKGDLLDWIQLFRKWFRLPKRWLRLLVRMCLALGNSEEYSQSFWAFAYQTGRLTGCIKYRTFSPW